MIREAVVDPGAFGPLAAILEDGRLVSFFDPPLPGEAVTDTLFLARVVRVEPRMNAAFLDLGKGLTGFATAKDVRRGTGADRPLAIERLVREGERLIVQGVREADEDKHARFTTDVRLFGLFLVHRPLATAAEVSGRARGRLRQELRERALRLFPEGGFVLRRHAAAVADEVLREEAMALAGQWRDIRRQAAERRAPGPLAGSGEVLETYVRAFVDEDVRRVTVADAALAARLRGLLERLPATLRPELRRLADGRDAFADAGVRPQLAEALAPVVPLAGGRIVIEPTLACVAIDVDGEGRPALEINLEAAGEIGRQVRLRNLGGTIIVDFLDLTRPGDRRRLEEALKRAFRDDPAQAQVHGMSPLGIVQISRARRGRPLAARYRRPCHCCGVPGREPSLEAQIEELFQEFRRRAPPPPAIYVGERLGRRLQELALPWLEGLRLIVHPKLAADGFTLEASA